MSAALKRFYKEVTVRSERPSSFQVLLDGRSIRTPAKEQLVLPSLGLAEVIAAEWRAQTEQVRPGTMPFMSLACAAVDHVLPRRAQVIEEVAAFGAHDLVCYWADDQLDLVFKQQQCWQPLLDWAALTHDARLTVVRGIVPQDQPAAALRALRLAVEAHKEMNLACLATATQATGSLIIALALLEGQITVDEAQAASQLDELYQIELWGDDAEAKARRGALRQEMDVAARFAGFLRSD